MFDKIKEKQIQKLMEKMNMKMRNIDAEEVVIKCKDKKLIIKNPEITIADLLGKEVYQIIGDVIEGPVIKEEDVKLIMEKTGRDKETAEKTLERLDNDLAKTIMELKKKK